MYVVLAASNFWVMVC